MPDEFEFPHIDAEIARRQMLKAAGQPYWKLTYVITKAVSDDELAAKIFAARGERVTVTKEIGRREFEFPTDAYAYARKLCGRGQWLGGDSGFNHHLGGGVWIHTLGSPFAPQDAD